MRQPVNAFFGLAEWVQLPVSRKWQQELESLLSDNDDQDGETRGHTRRVIVGKVRKHPLGSLIGFEKPSSILLPTLTELRRGVGGSLHRSRPTGLDEKTNTKPKELTWEATDKH